MTKKVINEVELEVCPGATLSEANLSWANLSEDNLSEANLSWANLSEANLSKSNLSWANLSWANLSWADLSWANLSWADLSWANLSWANLSGATLEGATLPAFQIPQEGTLTVYKKLENNLIAKLLVPEEAKRTASLVGRKCRAEYVRVLEIKDEEGASVPKGRSLYDDYTYTVGDIIKPDSYNPDIRIECTNGIHFFLTKEEAEAY